MKKFAFSMQKLLEYTSHIEENEKTVLLHMRHGHKILCGQLRDLRGRMEVYRRAYEGKCADGIVIRELIVLRQYLKEMEKQMEQLLVLIGESENAIEKQIDKIVGISKDKHSMDKLKDKSWQAYQYEQRKNEEILIDEFVSNAEFASKRRFN